MTITSRLATWVSSCASTPSSSAGLSRERMPVVTATVAFLGERPRAKAFGWRDSATATLGLGRSACTQRRSTIACSSGACSGVTSWAPMAASASLSEANTWTSSSTTAMTPTSAPLSPAASRAATSTAYTAPSRNSTKTILTCRPVSLPKAVGRAMAAMMAEPAQAPLKARVCKRSFARRAGGGASYAPMRLRLLVATALLPLVLWAAVPLISQGATAGRVTNKLDRKRKALERNRDRDRVLTTDVSALHRRIGGLQHRQRAYQADLDRKRAVLVRTQDDLRDQRARLARLRARLQVSRRVLAARLIEIYKSDEPDIVTVILQSNGFAQLLENAEYLDRLNDQDARVLSAVRDAKADATAT